MTYFHHFGRMILLFAAVVSFPRLSSGSESMILAGIEMKLGMSEEQLVTKLKEGYTLLKVDESGWVIYDMKKASDKIIGNIGFTGGRLSWISKDWGSSHSDEAISIWREVFFLLSNLTQNKPTPVLTHTKVFRQPGLTINEIELSDVYSGKKISISIRESKEYGNSLSISEILKAK